MLKIILLQSIITIALFSIYCIIQLGLAKLIEKICSEKSDMKWEFGISTGTYFLWIFFWILSIDKTMEVLKFEQFAFFISFFLMGVFSSFWCYITFITMNGRPKLRWATKKEQSLKKIVVYSCVLIFIFLQGYVQTCDAMKLTAGFLANYKMFFSVTNYSAIASVIAMDRLMNQIVNIISKKTKSACMTDSEKINLVFEKMSIMEKELAELKRDFTCLEIMQKKEKNEETEKNMSEHFKVEKNELDIIGLKAEINVLDIRVGNLESGMHSVKEKLA